MSCPVCDGRKFLLAAKLSVLPTDKYGNPYVAADHGLHRKALWHTATVVPCWACANTQKQPHLRLLT